MSENLENKEYASLLEVCKEYHLTLGSVESLTGGLFASHVCSVPGASASFLGGIVTYAISVKTNLAFVPQETIEKYGVVSTQVAEAMAKGGAKQLHCDVVISFTGNAGPAAQGDKPVGCVAIGYDIGGEIYSEEIQLSGSRNDIREKACSYGAMHLLKLLKEKYAKE